MADYILFVVVAGGLILLIGYLAYRSIRVVTGFLPPITLRNSYLLMALAFFGVGVTNLLEGGREWSALLGLSAGAMALVASLYFSRHPERR